MSLIIKQSYGVNVHEGYYQHPESSEAPMTKADIAERIYSTTDLSKKEAVEVLEEVFAIIKSTLESGENLKISGFGSFEVKQKKDRIGRNPQTGEKMTIIARKVLTFKSSKTLISAINGQTP
jgi:integration host factor subunit alpha